MKTLLAVIALLAPASALATTIAGPIVNTGNGHTYYLLAPSSWTDAEAEAVALGGHLVTIDDATENIWVWMTFVPLASGQANLWIGLSDAATEGAFAWASGQPVGYTHWAPSEPNDFNGEDYAHMVGLGFSGHVPLDWNDIQDSGLGGGGLVTIPHGVVEVVPEPQTLALLALGLAGLTASRARRRS